MAPLAAFHGLKPPAPAWFVEAVAQEPERTFIEVEGAQVELLAWGERGRPGLMFLHGGAAHADWWSFIAPFFARERRVVASTFTGMGLSGWRDAYVFNQFVREAREAGRMGGAFDAGPPVVVGHSFGGRVAMGLARDFGDELMGAAMVDPPFFAPQNQRPPRRLGRRGSAGFNIHWRRSWRASASRRRKRATTSLFSTISPGTRSLRSSTRRARTVGPCPSIRTSGRSSPASTRLRSSAARCPLALVRGAKSQLFHPEDAAYLWGLIAPGSPYVEIPEAEHHVMIDQPLGFVAALRALLATWPGKRE